jgi:hypothetical protein
MLRKILALTVALCVATLLMPANAMAWGGGSWNRSGSASYTGRYGNTYSRNYSSSGSFGGGGYRYGGYRYGGYHYGGGAYYGGGVRPGGFLAGYAAGVYNSQQY